MVVSTSIKCFLRSVVLGLLFFKSATDFSLAFGPNMLLHTITVILDNCIPWNFMLLELTWKYNAVLVHQMTRVCPKLLNTFDCIINHKLIKSYQRFRSQHHFSFLYNSPYKSRTPVLLSWYQLEITHSCVVTVQGHCNHLISIWL